jgi:hypothetical protein
LRVSGEADRDIRDDGSGRSDLVADDRDISRGAGALDSMCPPVECYLRLMLLKFRYRLGFESLCAEVTDSISWRRLCRIPLNGKVPRPTTLMKLTSQCEAMPRGIFNPYLMHEIVATAMIVVNIIVLAIMHAEVP